MKNDKKRTYLIHPGYQNSSSIYLVDEADSHQQEITNFKQKQKMVVQYHSQDLDKRTTNNHEMVCWIGIVVPK